MTMICGDHVMSLFCLISFGTCLDIICLNPLRVLLLSLVCPVLLLLSFSYFEECWRLHEKWPLIPCTHCWDKLADFFFFFFFFLIFKFFSSTYHKKNVNLCLLTLWLTSFSSSSSPSPPSSCHFLFVVIFFLSPIRIHENCQFVLSSQSHHLALHFPPPPSVPTPAPLPLPVTAVLLSTSVKTGDKNKQMCTVNKDWSRATCTYKIILTVKLLRYKISHSLL